ncbi:MAG: hypothetical protein K0S76_2434 [Herbinix sp.]|jgi:uncharacterized protein (DUF58 family)|nr:hypothetical protein [Herbinix sp.]
MTIIVAFLCIGAVYLLQSFIYSIYWDKNLKVELQFQTYDLVEGEKNLLKEVITNAKRIPLPILHVKFRTSRTFLFDQEENSAVSDYYYRDDVFAIGGKQIVTRHLAFLCSKRGCYIINDACMIASDLLLNKIMYSPIPTDTLFYVYPKKLDMSEFEIPYQSITGQYLSKVKLLEDPFEFRGIRKYEPYDSIKSINWKSSARNNTLLVNTFYPTSSKEIRMILNLDKQTLATDDEVIETAIRIASTLAGRLLSDHLPLSLETNAFDLYTNTRISIGTGSGNRHITAIDRCLARIDLTKKPSDFKKLLVNILSDHQTDHIYYFIISNYRKPDLLTIYSHLKENRVPCCLIIPESKTAEPVELSQDDMYAWEVSE